VSARVTLNELSHSWASDLNIMLEAPRRTDGVADGGLPQQR
jgi:hypothetical protein